MAQPSGLIRKSHFLGAKIRALRKRNGLTLEDLSVRCIGLDARHAPSVSYLSMIENGRRVPSERLLRLLAQVFQRDIGWFLDENLEAAPPAPSTPAGGVQGVPLKPGFLFSTDLLETAIPELLSETGTTGRQFAHLLIRAYQERQRNQFPDLERAAEEVGRRRFPLPVPELLALYDRHGLRIRWFERPPVVTRDDAGRPVRSLMRSFFEPPGDVYMNALLRREPARLKYDLAAHLGHQILHDGDGVKSIHATGGFLGGAPQEQEQAAERVGPQDILSAWRDFECSFFAGALLCPRLPFRRFLLRAGHEPDSAGPAELTAGVLLRRMTAVSPYPHWHYFDAYPPGYLRAVYRGNGIALPWGNLRQAAGACPQWAVFRMLARPRARRAAAQISLLVGEGPPRLYGGVALRSRDAAGNRHVVSAGIDLGPALWSQQEDSGAMAEAVAVACAASGGAAPLPGAAARAISVAARILGIRWLETALEAPVEVICPRSSSCPRRPPCAERPPTPERASSLDRIRQEIVRDSGHS